MSNAGRQLAAIIALMGLLVAGCGGAGGDAEGPTRSVQHAMGVSEVPMNPERVVVLDTGELDSVLALGIKPVGAVRADEVAGPQAYLGQQAQGIEPVGTIESPNLEAIVALKPDVILSNSVRHEDIYAQLNEIAPTVFAGSVGESWKENLRLAGTALGKSDQAERILADYENKAKQVGTAFGDPAQVEVSMVRFMANGIRLYGEGSFIGTILSDVGFARPPIARTDETFVQIGPEQVSSADGDLLFYAGYGNDGLDEQAKLAAGPLWQRLGAVSRGDAHPVSDDLWYLGIGPIAANQVLDELPRYVPQP